jgi:hypothetical protein
MMPFLAKDNLADLTTNKNASICGYVTKGTQGK